jgi:hypothetical protein
MHKLLILAFLIACLAFGAAIGCGSTEDGPRFLVDLNLRDLCNYNVSVETESRCMVDDDCSGQNQFCWFSTEAHFKDKKGFCRECEDDGACDMGLKCDHGWCHMLCTADVDCDATEFCTGSFCRKPHKGIEFSFSNRGNKDLDVYLDQVTLHGNDEACVFSRFEWAPAGGTATLAPGDFSLYLNVKFTPKDVGEFRGFIKIPNNSIDFSPMLIFMCGQAVESVCSVSADDTCPECASCLQEDFTAILESEPTPDCTGYF